MAANTVLNITAVTAQALAAIQALQARLGGLQSTNTSPSFAPMLSGLAAVAAAVAGVVAAASAISGAFQKGLNINAEVESATLGIKSLIAALTTVRDATGKTATGDDQLQIAGAIAEEQTKKLRIAGLQTAASFQQLLGAFQQGIGAGSGAGLVLDEIREITVGIVQAAGALGMPMDQLNQEVRSLLAGDISNDSNVAKALGITNVQVKAWREAGTLAENLNKKLEVFKRLGPETGQTWTATLANLSEGVALFLGTMSEGAFNTLKKSLSGALSGIFEEGTTNLSKQYAGIADAGTTAFTAIGNVLSSTLEVGISLIQDFSGWLSENKTTALQLGDAASGIWENFKGVVGAIASVASFLVGIVGSVGQWLLDAGFLTEVFRGVAITLALIRDGFKLMEGAAKAVGAEIIDGIGGPLRTVLGNLRDFLSKIPAIGTTLASGVDSLLRNLPTRGAQLRADAAAIRKDFEAGNTAVINTVRGFKSKADILREQAAAQKKLDAQGAAPRGSASPNKAEAEPDKAKAKAAERAASKLRTAEQALAAAEAEAAKKRAASLRDTEQAQLSAALDKQLVTYVEYLDKRGALEKRAIDEELTAQLDKRKQILSNLASEPDAAKKIQLQADLTKVNADIDALGQKKLTIEAKVVLEKEQFAREVASLKIDITANILDAQGNSLQASLLKLGQETDALLRDKRVAGNAELEDLVRKQSAQKDSQLRFDDAGKQASLLQAQLASQEAEVARQVSAGQLTQLDADGRILEARKATAAAMWDSVEAAKALAAASGNPQLVQSASELEAKYKELSTTLNTTSVALNESFFGALKTGFQDLISGAKSFGDVMKNIISSVLSKLAELAINQAFGSLVGGMGGLGGGIGGLFSSVFGFAEGGAVRGPGTGTSDSILAKLSNGEFVLKAAAVRALGVDRLNYANKYGKLPGFASGGLVGGAGAGAGAGLLAGLGQREATTVNNEISVSPTITLHTGKVSKALFADSEFRRELLVLVGDSGKKIRSAWGT